METVWKKIYRHLKEKGFEVYSPGQHKGECNSKYIVINDGGMTIVEGVSSGQKFYEILCYVPINNFSELEPFVFRAKEAMKELFPLIRPSGTETPAVLDEDVEGHMISVEYINYRKYNYL